MIAFERECRGPGTFGGSLEGKALWRGAGLQPEILWWLRPHAPLGGDNLPPRHLVDLAFLNAIALRKAVQYIAFILLYVFGTNFASLL